MIYLNEIEKSARRKGKLHCQIKKRASKAETARIDPPKHDGPLSQHHRTARMMGSEAKAAGGTVADIDALIEQILAAGRRRGGGAFSSSKVYHDEPVICRGSQMSSYLPEPCRQMRALARTPQAHAWTSARLFVEQARLMADYEDDFPYQEESFSSYLPSYDAMSDPQLRGYFTWRAEVRRGHVKKVSSSFAYVYLYELINGIGVEAGEGAFAALESFWNRYRDLDPSLDRYARPWLVDYVVYHGLDARLVAPYVSSAHDRAVHVLARAARRTLAESPAGKRRRASRSYQTDPAADEELFAALDELSTYQPRESRLFKDAPGDLVHVSCAVFSSLARYYRGARTQGLVESLFGTRHSMPHLMFASALFYPGERHEDCVYELNETRRYECRGGIWSCDGLHDGGGRSAKLGRVLRATDRQLRIALDYPQPLKECGDPKYLVRLIDREVEDYLKWKDAHAPRRVEIDLSQLSMIRATAAATCESLLVDEERAEIVGPDGAAEPKLVRDALATVPAAPSSTPSEESPLGLAPDERAFLLALIAEKAPEAGALVDLMVDAINEKLFDLLGDTALEFGADGKPRLIEDYRDDVRAALGTR